MKRLIQITGATVAIVSLVFVGSLLIEYAPDIKVLGWNKASRAVITAMPFYIAGIISGALAWVLLLGDSLVTSRSIKHVLAFCLSQIGKYIPGNFAHHVGKVILTQRLGKTTGVIMSALFIETAWIIGAGLALGSGFLIRAFGFDDSHFFGPNSQWIFLSFAGILLLLAPLMLTTLRDSRLAFLRVFSWRSQLFLPSTLNLLGAVVFLFSPFVLAGIGSSLVLSVLGVTHTLSPVDLSGAFAAAWVAGFVLPGASAGLGVREAILITLLAPPIGELAALQLAIALRVATTVGDVIVFLAAWAMNRTIVQGR